MRKLILILACVISMPLQAQVTQAKFDSAVARIAVLEQILGTKFNYPRPTSSIAADLIPANTLPTGQYPYILSDYQIRVGLTAFATSSDLNAVKARVTTLESQPSGGTNVVASGDVAAVSDNTGGGHYASLGSASLLLKANTLRNVTQGGITSTYCGYINQNGWDGGLRFQQNMAGQISRCAPELPGGQFGGDSRFTWSYSQDGDDATNATLPANARYGQSFVLDGGFAQAGYSYVTGAQLPRGVLLAAQRGGNSLYFGITPFREVGQYPQNKVPFALIADGSDSPVQITASGIEGRIRICNVNGVQVLCLGNAANSAARRKTSRSLPPVMKLKNPLGTLPEDSERK
jgi:hypothetical protein